MSDLIRFEVKLPPERRAALDALAKEAGISAPDLARLGIAWVLSRREFIVSGHSAEAA